MLMYSTGTLSPSSKKQSEQPTESQLKRSLEAKDFRGCLKTMVRRFCQPIGSSMGPVPETVGATGALEDNRVSDCSLVASSPPRVEKSQTHTREYLDI